MALTGKDVSDLMAEYEITFSAMRLRYQCILGRNIQQGAFRKLLKDESPLPGIITREALIFPHAHIALLPEEDSSNATYSNATYPNGPEIPKEDIEDIELFEFKGFKP